MRRDVAVPNSTSNERLLAPLERAAKIAASGDIEGGRRLLAPIAGQVWTGRIPAARPLGAISASLPPTGRRCYSVRRSAAAWTRDRYRCRYCSQRIVPRRVLVALSTLYPTELPYYTHYKRGTVHPCYWFVAAEADHLDPGSRGGAWADVNNLVTACAQCNMSKGSFRHDEVGWTLEPIPTDSTSPLCAGAS